MQLLIFILLVFIAMFPLCSFAEDSLPIERGKGIHSVMDFGAKGDGVTDDTQAFQKGLDAVAEDGAGILFVPTGNYLIKGHLSIPDNVTLEGVFRAPTRSQDKGSILLAVEGKGNPDGEPFIFMSNNTTLKGVTIRYPEQDPNDLQPYPWCVRGRGDNISIIDVFMVNPWMAVDFGTNPCGRHYIRNLYGQPLYKGLFIDKCFDVGRIENIHFWPFWNVDVGKVTEKTATAFIFSRSDWEFVNGLFCIWYKVGFHFVANDDGGGNYLITNSGSDIGPIAVKVDRVQNHSGVAFTNCQIMAGVEVGDKNGGPLKFNNCGFWGVKDVTTYHADLKGAGHVTFNACHFLGWDQKDEGVPCIIANNRGITITGCDFVERDKKHVFIGKEVKGIVITGNHMRGGIEIENNSPFEAAIGLNTSE